MGNPVCKELQIFKTKHFSAWGVWKVEVENMRGAEKGYDFFYSNLEVDLIVIILPYCNILS